MSRPLVIDLGGLTGYLENAEFFLLFSAVSAFSAVNPRLVGLRQSFARVLIRKWALEPRMTRLEPVPSP